jgi:hypothetical protein
MVRSGEKVRPEDRGFCEAFPGSNLGEPDFRCALPNQISGLHYTTRVDSFRVARDPGAILTEHMYDMATTRTVRWPGNFRNAQVIRTLFVR